MTQHRIPSLVCLALPLALSLGVAAPRAQWLPNGSDIYFNTGHVGVGLISPLADTELHVGTSKVQRGIYSANYTSIGTPVAIEGYVAGANGIGIEGLATADTGRTFGVVGQSAGEDGAGVFGQAIGKGRGIGVWAIGRGQSAHGVWAEARNYGYGVRAIGTYADAVWAESYLGHAAVHGKAHQELAAGVLGESGAKAGDGVRGVYGFAFNNATAPAGVKGVAARKGGYGVFSDGDFGGTGAKYFVQPHPNDPALAVRFVCLEGNESGTYFRGTMRLRNGRAEIEIPESWRHVSEAAGITVQVTPVRSLARLAVWEKSRERIVIAGDEDCEFDYFVNGVRRGFADFEPTVANRYFRPSVRDEPFGAQFPEALRQILVENGTLNPDFTPNEGTAARLGWRLASMQDAQKEHGHACEERH